MSFVNTFSNNVNKTLYDISVSNINVSTINDAPYVPGGGGGSVGAQHDINVSDGSGGWQDTSCQIIPQEGGTQIQNMGGDLNVACSQIMGLNAGNESALTAVNQVQLLETTDSHQLYMNSFGVNLNSGNNLPLGLNSASSITLNSTTSLSLDIASNTGTANQILLAAGDGSCNWQNIPSASTIGVGTETDSAICYLPFVHGSGFSESLYIDSASPLTYMASTGTLSALIFNGNLNYTPFDLSYWASNPNNVYTALNRMGKLLYTLNGNSPIPN
jgi:hypothetical protein